MAGIQIKGTGRAATYPNSNKGIKKVVVSKQHMDTTLEEKIF